jgi:hypothetical protein
VRYERPFSAAVDGVGVIGPCRRAFGRASTLPSFSNEEQGLVYLVFGHTF